MNRKLVRKVRQVEIAQRVGLDVSSVNKILNRSEGPVFRKETIALVFKVAKEMGYNFKQATKLTYKNALRELVPLATPDDDLALKFGITAKRVTELKNLIYGRAK